jgi:hypothetical protein
MKHAHITASGYSVRINSCSSLTVLASLKEGADGEHDSAVLCLADTEGGELSKWLDEHEGQEITIRLSAEES